MKQRRERLEWTQVGESFVASSVIRGRHYTFRIKRANYITGVWSLSYTANGKSDTRYNDPKSVLTELAEVIIDEEEARA